MGQKKLKRFAEVRTFPNFLEYPTGMAGRWNSFFKNLNPIVLELACGKGEYTTGLARMYPQKNFIGVDLKSNRIWVGAKLALEENLGNVAFIRTQIDKLTNYFVYNEVAEIWITFPDPQLRGSKSKKRLTHPRFLRLYQQVLSPAGKIHLKTDSPDLYEFTKKVINLFDLQVINDLQDVYAENNLDEVLKIKTHYEKLDIARSNRVHYLQFKLSSEMPEQKDIQLKEKLSEEQAD